MVDVVSSASSRYHSPGSARARRYEAANIVLPAPGAPCDPYDGAVALLVQAGEQALAHQHALQARRPELGGHGANHGRHGGAESPHDVPPVGTFSPRLIVPRVGRTRQPPAPRHSEDFSNGIGVFRVKRSARAARRAKALLLAPEGDQPVVAAVQCSAAFRTPRARMPHSRKATNLPFTNCGWSARAADSSVCTKYVRRLWHQAVQPGPPPPDATRSAPTSRPALGRWGCRAMAYAPGSRGCDLERSQVQQRLSDAQWAVGASRLCVATFW